MSCLCFLPVTILGTKNYRYPGFSPHASNPGAPAPAASTSLVLVRGLSEALHAQLCFYLLDRH